MPGRLQFLSGLLSFSVTFHYSWQSQGKHNGKAVVQLPHSPEFSLESSGMDSEHSAGLGPSPGFRSSASTVTGRVARVTPRELNWEPGTTLEQEEPPLPLGCVHPVLPGVLAVPTCCPPCELTQPAWDAGLGSLTSAHCRAG